MDLSVQLYTVRAPLQEDRVETINRLASIGFTSVEPYDFHTDPAEWAELFRSRGIAAPTAHGPVLGPDAEAVFAAAATIGIGTVFVPFVDPERWTDRAGIDETAAQVNAAARRGGELGIRVGYHNHHFELVNRVGSQTALEYFAEQLDPEVVLELDTYWALVGGADPVALLDRLGERVVAVHLKDGPATLDTGAQVPAGQGVVPVRDIVAAARFAEVGVVEFDAYAGDIFDGVAQSLAYLSADGSATS